MTLCQRPSLVYHLRDVFQAVRSHSLGSFPYPARHFFFPMVGELHSLWFFLMSGGDQRSLGAIGFGLLPFSLIAGVAVRAAAERLGLRISLPWLVPGMMLTPILLIQPLSGYVDVGLAVTPQWNGARYCERRRPKELLRSRRTQAEACGYHLCQHR